jgi:Ni,Fe-hydrogenase I cytochrome b subunit
MSANKAEKLWIVNIISFILLMVLAVTGLINWLLVPGGYRGEGGFMMLFRHFLREIHEWTGLLFIIVIIIHLTFHWPYIKSNLKKYGKL